METIQRYSVGDFASNEKGPFVFFDDHRAAVKELCEALEGLDKHIDFGEETPDNTAWTFDKGDGITQACRNARTVLAKYKEASDEVHA